MSQEIIRVINPNSNQAVTEGMSSALEPLRMVDGPQIDCVTLSDGPFGVASDADVEAASILVKNFIENDCSATAFVIACYSDPGLSISRNITSKPVFGIGECAVLNALAMANRFGVISVSSWSVKRHWKCLRGLSLAERCAGDRPLGISVEESEDINALEKIAQTGEALRDEDGADIVITACAGMARHRQGLEQRLGIKIIEPVLAATTMALGAVRCG